MPPSWITKPHPSSLEYIIERSAESIVGYLRISKPDKALQVLLELQTYVKSLPMRTFESHDHMQILVGRVRDEISGMQGQEEQTASMLLGVLDTLERMKLIDSDRRDTSSSLDQLDIDMMDNNDGVGDCMVEGGEDLECQRCGCIIPARRLAQHLEFWCQPP